MEQNFNIELISTYSRRTRSKEMLAHLAPPPPRTRPTEVPVRKRASLEKSDFLSAFSMLSSSKSIFIYCHLKSSWISIKRLMKNNIPKQKRPIYLFLAYARLEDTIFASNVMVRCAPAAYVQPVDSVAWP